MCAGYPADKVKIVASRQITSKEKGKKATRDSKCTSQSPRLIDFHHIKKLLAGHCNTLFACQNKREKVVLKVSRKPSPDEQCQGIQNIQFVKWKHKAVYFIPLWCGKTYAGKARRCLNECLKERQYKLTITGEPQLKAHVNYCGCVIQSLK